MYKITIQAASYSFKILVTLVFLFPVLVLVVLPIQLWPLYDSTIQKYALAFSCIAASLSIIFFWLRYLKKNSNKIVVTKEGVSLIRKNIVIDTICVKDISFYGISNLGRMSGSRYCFFCSVPKKDIMNHYLSNMDHALSIYNNHRLNAYALDETDAGRWLMALDYYLLMHQNCDLEKGKLFEALSNIDMHLPKIYKMWGVAPTITGTWALENCVSRIVIDPADQCQR